jgi:hypothetical protein
LGSNLPPATRALMERWCRCRYGTQVGRALLCYDVDDSMIVTFRDCFIGNIKAIRVVVVVVIVVVVTVVMLFVVAVVVVSIDGACILALLFGIHIALWYSQCSLHSWAGEVSRHYECILSQCRCRIGESRHVCMHVYIYAYLCMYACMPVLKVCRKN